jgi:serine/threonine-protein phosphatase 2B regulatory subunit
LYHNQDQSQHVQETVHQIFKDLDINGAGELTLTEFKLMALKEPMMINFVDDFLRIPRASDDSLAQ